MFYLYCGVGGGGGGELLCGRIFPNVITKFLYCLLYYVRIYDVVFLIFLNYIRNCLHSRLLCLIQVNDFFPLFVVFFNI